MKANKFLRRFNFRKHQKGVLLIEVLCAIVIFSFGILGLVGLQTTAVAQSGDAKLRSAAAELADKYINQMWVSNRTSATAATTLQAPFSSSPPGAAYTAWLGATNTAGTVLGILPGTKAPIVTFQPQVAGCASTTPMTCTSQVSITMFWTAPHDSVQHQYTVNAQISLY
ncbi:hypothetical protein ACIPF8_08850 [Collimonas sp. NPDC087041]|uniref:type IV pilus modification PilV family protein n=1 Tax=Collimonas sp. NPDC087041 TaxID=3363960 RepID=UPI0038198D81